MYQKSTTYYDALYHFKDYNDGAKRLRAFIGQFHPQARSLLEVACGTGKYLEALSGFFSVEGLDINPQMLEQARARVPDVPLHLTSMVDFDLGKRFDVVACLFSSIGYVKTVEDFHATIDTLARHVAPGGLLIIEPFFTPETYWVNRITMNVVDQPELKIVWMYVSEREDRVARLDIHHMVGTPAGVEEFTERHEIGLFNEEDYALSFARAGLALHHDPTGLFNRGLYIGKAS